ncbi:MAG: LacI family DNA-binding transcriptional regulator [Bifidobacteriaceae bacterium]|nr:LacI family DNA-binding transcriptional regulator [Bifidobacteriaceae bacterium]
MENTKLDGNARVADIAEAAGVSIGTVSKVINGRRGVSLATREKVEKVLTTIGYEKPLVSTKTNQTIEFVVAGLENNGSFELVRELTYEAQNELIGVTVNRIRSGDDPKQHFAAILDRNPLGVVLLLSDNLAKERKLLASRNVPCIVINPVRRLDTATMTIDIDNWSGGIMATRHLIDLGHTRIGAITGPVDFPSSIARSAGYETALKRAGITPEPALMARGNYLSTTSYAAACRLLDMKDRPTAIFAFNDLSAVSLYKAARERGIRIPEELSVVGFDDVFPAQYLSPELTTVNQPFRAIARKAIEMILESRNGSLEERDAILPTHLVIRSSTATLRA